MASRSLCFRVAGPATDECRAIVASTFETPLVAAPFLRTHFSLLVPHPVISQATGTLAGLRVCRDRHAQAETAQGGLFGDRSSSL
jgi:hypothetical protein